MGQAIDMVVKNLDPNDSVQTRDIIAEGNSVLRLIGSIWKKGKQEEQKTKVGGGYQQQFQLVKGVEHLVGGNAFLAHKSCCATCSSGEIKQLLSRFIR